MTGLQELHRRALQVTVDVANEATVDRLGLPTPCAEWDLGALLAHMAGQNHGFAAAARGERSDRGIFDPRPVEHDPAGVHAASAADLAAAFAEPGVTERQVWLPEVREALFPGTTVIGFHLVDSVAHGWDVARALDLPVAFDDEVLDAALVIALAVPEGPAREQPGASFRPGVRVAHESGTLERVLGLLGRSPDWKP